ncbi:unnamed protein product [Orchesella dallaii]|uniref:Uncharacterized protein n=1 Tax=Orchesella dallaii TaxID=48710 RepID=A0ABP1R8J4_9HEXA
MLKQWGITKPEMIVPDKNLQVPQLQEEQIANPETHSSENGDEELKTEMETSLCDKLFEGDPVLHRWIDGYYHSGVAMSLEINRNWMIQFNEESRGLASEDCTFPIDIIGAGMEGQVFVSEDVGWTKALVTKQIQ